MVSVGGIPFPNFAPTSSKPSVFNEVERSQSDFRRARARHFSLDLKDYATLYAARFVFSMRTQDAPQQCHGGRREATGRGAPEESDGLLAENAVKVKGMRAAFTFYHALGVNIQAVVDPVKADRSSILICAVIFSKLVGRTVAQGAVRVPRVVIHEPFDELLKHGWTIRCLIH